MKLPEKLNVFIEKQDWIFAKTYADTYPHEYIVQEQVDNSLFIELGNFIDAYGYESYFYKTKQVLREPCSYHSTAHFYLLF